MCMVYAATEKPGNATYTGFCLFLLFARDFCRLRRCRGSSVFVSNHRIAPGTACTYSNGNCQLCVCVCIPVRCASNVRLPWIERQWNRKRRKKKKELIRFSITFGSLYIPFRCGDGTAHLNTHHRTIGSGMVRYDVCSVFASHVLFQLCHQIHT